MSKIDRFSVSYARWVIKHKWWVALLAIGVLAAKGAGFGKLRFNSDSAVFFSPTNPQYLAYEAIKKTYTRNDLVFVGIEATDGNVFQPRHLAAIQQLVDSAWKTPFSYRVDALTNYQHTRAEGDDLYVANLVGKPDSLSPQQLVDIKAIAVGEPLLFNRVINSSGSMTGVNISTEIPSDDPDASLKVMDHVRQMTAKWQAQYPDLKVYITGNVALNSAFSESAQRDGQTLIPAVFVIFMLMIYFTSRSVMGSLGSIVVLLLSIGCTLGTIGLLGIDLTAASGNAPIVIATLAIADCIHLLTTVLQQMRKGLAKNEAIVEGLRLNMSPIFVTSFTTIVGFLSLNTGDVPPYADFGNISAIGMTYAWLFSVTLLPALLAILPLRAKVQSQTANVAENPFYDRIGLWVSQNRVAVLTASVAVVGLGSFFTLKNELNDEFIKYFDHSLAFRTDTDHINQNLTGLYSVEYSVGGKGEGGINDPAYLQKLEAFTAFAKAQPEVLHVSTYSDVIKKINRAMHGDTARYYTIPASQEEAAQYLLLYELSLPYGLSTNNQVNAEKSATRFVVTLKDLTSNQMIGINRRLENWLEANTPAHMHALGASSTLIFAYLAQRQVASLVSGALLSAVIITLILMATFRSFKYGLISLVPNLVPALIGFGLWYPYQGYINMGMTPVFGMTLGIIVDNCIHFISKYLRARREYGQDEVGAVRMAFNTVVSPIVATALILCTGFVVLTQSSFALNSSLAAITVLILLAAVPICLFTLPALILTLKSTKPMNLKKVLQPAALALFLTGLFAFVQQNDKGLEIAKNIENADNGYKNSTADLKMVLTDKQGQQTTRAMANRILEVKGDGDKSIVEFLSPSDVKGAKTLTYTHKSKDDDQWLYLPSVSRVKRISSSNKSGPFMGSEFSFEDLSSFEVEKFSHKLVSETTVGSDKMAVLEQVPTDPMSGYSKRVVTVNLSKNHRMEKIEYFDKKGTKLKTMTYQNYTLYAGKYWRASSLLMINHQNGRKTELIFSNYKFGTSLTEDDFSVNNL